MIGPRKGKVTRWLLMGLLLGVVSWSATEPSAADGPSSDGLVLRVTVNTRPGLGAQHPGIRTGASVLASYRLVNRGSADLHDLRIQDPVMPGARVRCPGGRDEVPLLTGLREVRCTATGVARPGARAGVARAVGWQPYLRARVVATARSGYAGVGAALALREEVRVLGPDRARIRYTVTNTGNRSVRSARLRDPVVRQDRTDCGGGRSDVPPLAPRGTATCTAEVRRPPGSYVSRGHVEGTDRLRTIDAGGGWTPPRRLTARASARFVLPGRVPRTPPRPTPPRRRPPGDARTPPEQPPRKAAPVDAVPQAVAPIVPPPPPPPPPGLVAPGIPEPGEAEARPHAVAPPPPVGRPPARPQPPTPPEQPPRSLLSRFVRADHTPTGLGVGTALFLVLLPAAVAAAVLGSRRH
ncbi:hypothetical protein [Streptomyces formicae]|uniref:Uncharacterized protein n=1 Tax=Streptomyces formicae TaxID=1616117 RepID=A0A291QCY1_9ACTN|nr:hypothetical protein [Streptomyces formicae]ATL29323.1 hypothetical protein KY5_4305 [Streptomyces formicae]